MTCNKKYFTMSGLLSHDKTYHPRIFWYENKSNKSKSKSKCKFCNKKISNYISMIKHEKKCKFSKTIFEQNEIFNLNIMIKESFSSLLLNKLSTFFQNIVKLKNKVIDRNKHKTEIIPVNTYNTYNNYNQTYKEIFKINNKEVKWFKDYYFDATEICSLFNKEFIDWKKIKTTNDTILHIEQLTNIPIDKLIITNNKQILIHPFVTSQLLQWLNPIYGITFNQWLIERKMNDKNGEINLLVNNFVNKHIRNEYLEDNVVYL